MPKDAETAALVSPGRLLGAIAIRLPQGAAVVATCRFPTFVELLVPELGRACDEMRGRDGRV